MQAKVLSNAIWNVVNGGSAAIVAVVVPPFLTRQLAPEAYGAWAIALQIGTYVGLFGFGLQMAVGRYVAYAEARGDLAQRDGIVSTAFYFLLVASVVGWLAICGLALAIERLLPNLSPQLLSQTRAAVIFVGLALAIGLPASVFAAVFTGQHRSDVPAKIQGSGRILLALGLIAAGFAGDLAVLGLVYAAISILTVLALAYAWRTGTPAPTLARRLASRVHGRELAGFCLSLTIWSFAMLLISGLDLLIVGRWDYGALPYFAVGVTLTTLLSGTLTSLANALVPAAARVADDAPGELDALLLSGSRLIASAALIGASPLIFHADVVVGLWLSDDYAARVPMLVALLAIGATIRNGMLPYVTIAIGVGKQRAMIWTPMIEGGVSVALSAVLVMSYGAAGVAFAKLVGGSFGVCLLLAQHPLGPMLRDGGRRSYFMQCIARPLLGWLPVIGVAIAVKSTLPALAGSLSALALTMLVAIASAWFIVLSASDRAAVREMVSRRMRAPLQILRARQH